MRRYTIKDIAGLAEVAPSTVSRILGGKTTRVKVTEQTRERIFAAAKRLNYCPNVNAQRLVGSKANVLALEVPSCLDTSEDLFSDYFFRMMLRGLEGMVIARRYRLMIVYRHGKYIQDKEYLRLFREGSISGMLIWGAGTGDAYIRELYDLPVIQVGSYCELSKQTRYVGHDVEHGAFLVTEDVLKQGCRRIWCVWGPPHSSISQEHRRGVMRALAEYRLKPHMELESCGFGEREGEKAMEKLLEEGTELPDAVLFFTTTTAIGGRNALTRRGLSVPNDIVFGGGYGGADNCPWLSTYTPDCVNMGKLAAERVFALIDGETDSDRTIQEYIPVVLAPATETRGKKA